MRFLGKQKFGTPLGNVQFKTRVLIGVGRTIKTVMFLKERTTKCKCQIPKNVTIESKKSGRQFLHSYIQIGLLIFSLFSTQ